MPSIESNRSWWEGAESADHWARAGDNWSDAFGDPAAQWFGSLMPRVHHYLPAPRVLEIAPGFGRWTHYLKELADHLVIVDLSSRCIDACKERFAQSSSIEYHVNDGTSLSMIQPSSIDVVFSFDSLVHVELDVLAAYLEQIAEKLNRTGVAFLHHSNLGEHVAHFDMLDRLSRGRGLLHRLGLVDGSDQKRARSVTAANVKATAERVGLVVVSQEVITWSSVKTIDCISVFTRPGSPWDTGFRRVINRDFSREAKALRRVSQLYSGKRPR